LRHPDLVEVLAPGAIDVSVAGSSDPERFPGTSGGGVRDVVVIEGPEAPLEEC
jgi:hypothetical protein